MHALATLIVTAFFASASPDSDAARERVAVLAGGCFWGMEAVFERLTGVADVVSGFSGGSSWTAHYAVVGLGVTNHAEAVRITYDPQTISYDTLLKVYFSVAHDPTQLNRQGPDQGRQYRSSIFYLDEDQRQAAHAAIGRLDASDQYDGRIVTTVVPFEGFFPAGPEHQDFLIRHPTYPYIVVHDLPKLERLEAEFPELLNTED